MAKLEHKSEAMMQVALSNGWKAQVKPTLPASGMFNEVVWDLYCVRDNETLQVTWIGNRQEESTHTFFGTITHPPHKAAVIAVLEGSPNLKNIPKDKIEQVIETRIIPFEHDSPALDILLSVLGREITWVRKIDGEIMSGVVDKHTNIGKKYFRVCESRSGRRLLEWQDREGFHSVALEQIVQVA